MRQEAKGTESWECRLRYYDMSLRDWFAGQVISCLILSDKHHDLSTDQHARDAYIVADAMLQAREGKA